MDNSVKDFFQVLAWIVASIGGVVAAFKAVDEVGLNRRQRIEEFRWKQAAAAKDILDEMFSNEKVKNASRMLDWDNLKYEIEAGKKESISFEDMWLALRVKNTIFDPKEVYIRDCFDTFFDYVERIEHFIEIKLVRFEDVRFPLEYYAKKMNSKHDVFETYITTYEFQKSQKFLERFGFWKTSRERHF